MTDKLTIGIDLGGTKIGAALVDSNGHDRAGMREQTLASEGVQAVERRLHQIIANLIYSSNGCKPNAIGIGVAGQIDSKAGIVHNAPNLGWHDYPLGGILSDKFNLPVYIDNDVRMAAYGEWKLGAGQNVDNLVCIFVGTGVGGGIISGGRLITGDANTAGEIGHITVDLNGPSCHCSSRGCVEAYAGGWAIGLAAKRIIQQNPKDGAVILEKAQNQIEQVTAEKVQSAARDGDAAAVKILNFAIDALVAGITSVVNLLSPRRLILGGGVIEGYPEMIGQIEKGVRQKALTAAVKNVEFVKARLGAKAGILGAALAARDRL